MVQPETTLGTRLRFPFISPRAPTTAEKRDASNLIAEFGVGAYGEAQSRARSGDGMSEHWHNVRRLIGKRTGRPSRADTATRMLNRD